MSNSRASQASGGALKEKSNSPSKGVNKEKGQMNASKAAASGNVLDPSNEVFKADAEYCKGWNDGFSKAIQEAKAERHTILKEAREMKQSIINDAKTAASVEADKVIESARAQIENEKLAAITELKNQVANLSIDIAEKVLKSELADKQKQKDFVEAALKDADLN